MQHKEELERIRTVIEQSREDLTRELKHLPEGSLTMQVQGDRRFFYQHFPRTGNRKKARSKGITNDTDTVMGLVRKKYIEKALKVIEKDVRLLDKTINNYEPFDEQSLMKDYITKYPGLEAGLYHGMQPDEEWAEDYKKQEDFYKEQLIHVSAKGILMRSKGEVYIASRLDHYGIPYRYEAAIPHPDVDRVPDFTIKRPRDGKIIYWEHLGKTDSGGYLSGNEVKLIEFEGVEIAPWDNLIMTFDTVEGGMRADIIEAMIKCWLL